MKIVSILMLLLLSSCSWNRIYYYNESYDPQFQKKKELPNTYGKGVVYPVRVGQIYEFIQKHHMSKDYLKGLKSKVRYTYDSNIYSRVYISKGTRFKVIGLCRYYLSGPDEVGSRIYLVAKILNGKYKDELFVAKSGSISFLGGFVLAKLNAQKKTFSYAMWYWANFIKNGFKEIRELGSITAYDKTSYRKKIKLIKDSPYPLPTKKVRSWLFFSKDVVDYSWSEDKDLGKDLGSIYYNLKEAKKKEKANKNKSN